MRFVGQLNKCRKKGAKQKRALKMALEKAEAEKAKKVAQEQLEADRKAEEIFAQCRRLWKR